MSDGITEARRGTYWGNKAPVNKEDIDCPHIKYKTPDVCDYKCPDAE